MRSKHLTNCAFPLEACVPLLKRAFCLYSVKWLDHNKTRTKMAMVWVITGHVSLSNMAAILLPSSCVELSRWPVIGWYISQGGPPSQQPAMPIWHQPRPSKGMATYMYATSKDFLSIFIWIWTYIGCIILLLSWRTLSSISYSGLALWPFKKKDTDELLNLRVFKILCLYKTYLSMCGWDICIELKKGNFEILHRNTLLVYWKIKY